MDYRFTRKELHDLVWSQPITKLSGKYGLSDVGFAKVCRRAKVPVPPRGYWARVDAGKAVTKTPLPPRGSGMADLVEITPPVPSWPGGVMYGRPNSPTD